MIIWDVSAADVSRLEPSFRADVQSLLSTCVYDWRVVYAYRSIELQAKLYEKFRAGGPLAAAPGESAHNYGLAVDVQLWVQDDPTNSLTRHMEWNVKAPGWQWLFGAVKKAPRLHSGISFGDFDHIERYQWRRHKDWNAGRDV
jgi:hypothetical protein